MRQFTYFLIVPKGMDIHQLRIELCAGIRLPAPPDCPEVISSLINSCFHSDPFQRKTFKNIKQALSTIYSVIMENVYLRVDISPDTGGDQYKAHSNINDNYDIMRKLYEEIKLRNEDMNLFGSNFLIQQGCESRTAEKSSMQYVSLQNIDSNILAQESSDDEVQRTKLLTPNLDTERAVSMDGLSSVTYSVHTTRSSRRGDTL